MRLISRMAATVAATGMAVGLAAAVAPTAQASTDAKIAGTIIGIYPRTGTSMASSHAGPAISDGTVVKVYCEAFGRYDHGSNVWEYTNVGWLPNKFVITGYDGRSPYIPECGAQKKQATKPAPRPAPKKEYLKDVDVEKICRNHDAVRVTTDDWSDPYSLFCVIPHLTRNESSTDEQSSSAGSSAHVEGEVGTDGARGRVGGSSSAGSSKGRSHTNGYTYSYKPVIVVTESRMQKQCEADYPGSKLILKNEHGAKGWRCQFWK